MSMIDPKSILKHELIGLSVRIEDSANKSQVGISGTVVDETMNTLSIDSNGIKVVAKEESVFVFSLDQGKVRVDGNQILGRPQDRIKKRVKKW